MKLMKGNGALMGRGRPRWPGDAMGSAIIISPSVAPTQAAPAEADQNVSRFRGCHKPQKEDVLEFLVAGDRARPSRLVFAVSVPRRVRRQELTGTDQTSPRSGRFPVCKLQLC